MGYTSPLVAFVASGTKDKVAAPAVLRSILKDTKHKGQGETYAKKRQVTFGTYKRYNFTCDTITKRYDYHAARSKARPVKWNVVRAEKAKWHAQLARIIANELCREVFEGSDGLIFAIQKEFMRWIIDSGSGFDLISGQSISKDDRRMVTKTDNPCRMATANGITTADEQVSVHVNGNNSAVDAVILDNSPCNVLSLGKLCMEKGFGFEWKPGEPPKLFLPDGTVRVLMVDQYVPVLASALVSEETEEANLKQESKDAPPDAGGKEATSSVGGNPST